MTSKEKKLWEQAIRVLKQNSVTVGASKAARQEPTEVSKQVAQAAA